jgi:two-component system, OmpR family, phosphate regulon sensor histidine kinase PhoR
VPDTPTILAFSALAVAVGALIGAICFAVITLPAQRKIRSLEAHLAHLNRQLNSPRPGDLRPLVDALPDPMILIDAGDKVTMLNSAAVKLLQVSGQAAIGKPFVAVITDQVLLELFDQVRKVPASEPRALAQTELKLHRSGTRFVFQSVAVRNPGGAVLLVLRDVTQMAANVQMKTDFVSNAGHELRTPIAAIKLAFETLRAAIDDDPPQTTRCIGIIDGHIRRLEEMLADLLDLSRVESPDLQAQVRSIRAADAFSMVRSTLGPIARDRGIELTFEAPREDEPFATDTRLLNLVLKNLVENSVKFTPAGGHITVTLGPAEPGPNSAPDAPLGYTLIVADTGVGIAPEHLPRIFERFYQVDPARTGSSTRGTGLGLAIVKHAVHALGGNVSLNSSPGKGTTVVCTFPPGKPLEGDAEAA